MNTLLAQFNDMLKRSGKAAIIDNVATKVIFKEYNDTTQSTDYKYILTNPVDLIKQGSYINSLAYDWLAISKPVNYNGSYDKTIIRKINYTIKCNFSGNIKQYKCIVDTQSFDIQTGQYVSVPVGKIIVAMQYNTDSRDIGLNQRFYFASKPYKVTGIDRASEGLAILYCDLDSIDTVNDDITNEIADRWRFETTHTYALTITNGDTANVLINNTYQLNTLATDNGQNIVNPQITFSSSDPTVASVDNNGIVMGINDGVATITAKLTYHNTTLDTITVTTVEILTHTYNINIFGSTTLKRTQTLSYVGHIYDNGSEITNKSLVWSIRNQDNTATLYATITATTGNSCSVKGVTDGKNVILKAALSDDPTVFTEFTIQIKSPF